MHDQSDESRLEFRDRLLAADSLSPASEERFKQELHAMFVRELTTPRRIAFSIVAIVSLVMAGVCGLLSLTEPELPLAARVGLGVGTLFGLAWTVVLSRILWRGALDLKVDNRRIAAMVWGFTVLMMVLFLFLGMSVEDRLKGILMISYGLAFLIAAAVHWLTHRIEQAELATREKLLQLELRIAELLEQK